MAIDLFAGFVVGANRGAFKRDAGKQATGTRVAEDLGSHPSVRICGSVTSFGSTGNRNICSQFDLAVEDRFHASVIHDQQDQVRLLATDLETDASALQRVHGWGAPRSTELFAGPANHGSASV